MRRSGWWTGAIVLAAAAAPVVADDLPVRPAAPANTPAFARDLAATAPPPTDYPRLYASGTTTTPPSIYAPAEPKPLAEQTNDGGVHVDLNFRYLTDYVYRGVSHDRAVYVPAGTSAAGVATAAMGNLHASNFQADGKVSFDLGKLPHPYVGVFANVNDSDPLSRFQEIRPYVGFDYALRPVLLDAGVNTYIYPERERTNPSPNTSEVFLRLTIDDSYFTGATQPLLSPYLYTAYDYQRNNGWYLEFGVKHDFPFPDFGVTLTPYADVAYVSHFAQQFVTISPQDSGFQHYDVGLVASYSLNHLFDLAPRYGQFAIEGYLNYTGKFSNPILAVNEVWGGVGLKYRY